MTFEDRSSDPSRPPVPASLTPCHPWLPGPPFLEHDRRCGKARRGVVLGAIVVSEQGDGCFRARCREIVDGVPQGGEWLKVEV